MAENVGENKDPLSRPNLYKPNDPPLVSFQLTNPISYLKLWFKKVWANEGIILHLRVRPLTILVIALLLTSTGFGIGKFIIPSSIRNYFAWVGITLPNPTPSPMPTPTPTSSPWVEVAYAGIVHRSESNRFYLIIPSGEAISLELPANINLQNSVGKRILAFGQYKETSRLLKVIDASDMEILPTKTMPIPTVPLPTSTSTPEQME